MAEGILGRPTRLLPRILHVGAVLVPLAVILLATSSELAPKTLVVAGIGASACFVVLRRSYSGTHVPPLQQGVGITSAVSLGTGLAVLSALRLWLPRMDVASGSVLILAAGVLLTWATLETFATSFESHRRFLVVGAEEGTELLRNLARHPGLPFDCVGIVQDGSRRGAQTGPSCGTLPELGQIVTRARPDLIVLSDGPARGEALAQLMDTGSADFRVIGIHQFYEHALGRVPVENLSPVWFMSVLHLYQRQYSRVTKRIFDLSLAWIALAIVAPILLILAVLVRLSGPGPIIFRQIRLGEGGARFTMLKFRTMVDEAEDGTPVWASEHDARETRVGSFVRSTRLDELPQLWNVIRGDMSLVGPRPERPEFLTLLRREVPFWTSRHLVKPGITGWAQVRLGYTRDAGGAAEKLSYDLYYLRHRSVATDLAIITRTAKVVALAFAAHRRRPLAARAPLSSEPVQAPLAAGVLVATPSSEGRELRVDVPAPSS